MAGSCTLTDGKICSSLLQASAGKTFVQVGSASVKGGISCLAYGPYESLLAVGAYQGVLLIPICELNDLKKTSIRRYKIDSKPVEFPVRIRWSARRTDSNKSYLVVADAENPIAVFDATDHELIRAYREHSKDNTGIDCCPDNPTSFASSSKDCSVRLYDIRNPHSHSKIEICPFPVCGVVYNTFNTRQVGFGSTQGKYYVYDTRNLSTPYVEAKAHRKTVSTVIFLPNNELLSTAIDSTAKRWDLHKTICKVEYQGHINTRHFVGADAKGDYIALGGEDSTMRIYHKDMPDFVASIKVGGKTSSTYCCWGEENYLYVGDATGNLRVCQFS